MTRTIGTGLLAVALAVAAGVAPAARAGSASLAWDPSTNPNVSRYAVHHGPGSRQYDEVAWLEATEIRLDGLPDCAERYFAVRAYDAEGAPRGGFSWEIRGWPAPRIDAVYPSVLEPGTVQEVYVVGANFREGAGVEFDLPGIEFLSADVRDCRRMVVRFRVPASTPQGDAPMYVVNPDRTFGNRSVLVTAILSAPGSVTAAARTDVVDGEAPEIP